MALSRRKVPNVKVLIGITTRNRAAILAKAVQSALDQDYPDKEVAVFDDASTDETARLRAEFPQVRWLRAEEQQGYLPARNYLMRETDAPFYFSLDDDAWFIRGDEISRGVEVMLEVPEVAAIAYDILSPDRPKVAERAAPRRTHNFIGCGHLLRLSAVKQVGYYTPNPGFYGGEEKDLCIRLLDGGHELVFLPGVHVWHDKSPQARDLIQQHLSGVCNDLAFAFRRSPYPTLLWMMPGKILSHLRFAASRGLLQPCLKGMAMFLKQMPMLIHTRRPVSKRAFQEYRRRLRASV